MLEELKKFGSSQLGFEMEFGQVDIGKANKKTNKSERFKRRQKNFVTLSSINDVTPNSEKDVSLNSENDVKPSSMNNVTPNLLNSVTLTSINDATLNSEKDVTLTPENDATVSLNSDQETAHSTPTEETTKSLSTNLSAIFSDVSFVKKSKKRGFEIKDENLNNGKSLSEEPFRMRKKYLNLSKINSESLSLSQSQSSWEESADLNLLGDFTIEKRQNVFNSTNGIDQSVLGLDLTEEDSMMQSTNQSPTNQSPTNQSPTNQSLTDSHSFANSRLVSHLEENLETVSSPATKKRFRIHRVRRSLPLNESSLAKDSLKRATNHVNRILSGPNDEVANVDQNQGTKISNANLSLSGEKDEVANVDQTRGTKIPKGSSPNAFQLISNDMNENGTVGITTASQEKAKGEEVFFRKNRKRGYPSEQSSQATKKAKEAEHPEENQLKNDSGESGKNVKESDLEDDRIIKASGSGQQPDSGSPFTVRS